MNPMGMASIASLVGGSQALASALGSPSVSGAQASQFGSMVSAGIQQVNDQLIAGQVELQKLAVGQVENLHQTMIRLEEARLSFQLAMQVRNRVLEAYQEIIKMPV